MLKSMMTNRVSIHASHGGRGEEYPHSDQIQVAMLLLFLLAWSVDSIIVGFSTYLATLVPLILRLSMTVVSTACGLFLVRGAHRLVIDEVHDGPVLVDTGVFSLVRHPMYLGIILFYLGLSLSTLSIVSFGLWIGIFLMYDMMASYEERDLIRILGKDYIDYQRKVPKWIPRPHVDSVQHSKEKH
jgi:protein-S-isoprenylcysteine O-methyltransferase Ste14